MKKQLLYAALSVALWTPLPGLGSEASDIAALKRELAEMKRHYESRITALEQRVEQAEAKAAEAEEMAQTKETGAGESVAAATTTAGRGESAFNPAISLVLQGNAVSYSRDPEHWYLPGFQLGGHAELKPEGLSIAETELTASANVDDWFYGQTTIGLHEHEGSTEIDIEEAFVDALSLPAGLGLRFGRFYADIGYLNTRHTHTWDFANAPLPNLAFLGGQYNDDGLRLSWLASTDAFLEFGVEALRGEKYPANADSGGLLGGAQNYFVRYGQDLGISNSVLLGLSYLDTDPQWRTSGHAHEHEGGGDEVFAFSGSSGLTVADLVWKWAPEGNAQDRNFSLQGAYFYRDESGSFQFTNDLGDALLPYDGTQQGFYVQGVYQFMPRWRVGLRYDSIWSDNELRVAANSSGEAGDQLLEESGMLSIHDPYRWTVMADYSHSEFSRLRLQYARDYSRPGEPDDQFIIQYIMSLGAHGAHSY